MRAAALAALLAMPALAGCLDEPAAPWPGAMPLPPGDSGLDDNATAPRPEGAMTSALPMLPLRINARGEVEGVPTRREAYAYCFRENAPGLAATYGGDDLLRYWLTPAAAASADSAANEGIPWFADRLGQPVRAADIPAGEGALALWRSSDAPETPVKDLLAFWVLRPPADAAVRIDAALDPAVVEAMRADGLVAYGAPTPHSCCYLGWHMSPLAREFGLWERLFDPCHFSNFDPWRIVPAPLPPCSARSEGTGSRASRPC